MGLIPREVKFFDLLEQQSNTVVKGAKLLLLTLKEDGTLAGVSVPEETDGPYGRLRAARMGPDGALYVTTTNGADDKLLRISPRP